MREIQVLLEVSRLGLCELRIEAANLRRQPRREQPKALAGARLDQRTREEEIQLASRVRRAQQRSQPRGVSPRPLALEGNLERRHELLDLLEVPQLLARQARQSRRESPVLGIGEHQREG